MTSTLAAGNDLLRAVARLNRWASRHAALGVPFAQARLLALLDELGPARVGDIARADNSSQPSVTAALQRVQASGWAERVTDPADARASLVRLTEAGHNALADVRSARAGVLEPVLDELLRRDPDALGRVAVAVEVIGELLDSSTRPSPARAAGHPTNG